jgi:RNA polymerase sigma factor FliA
MALPKVAVATEHLQLVRVIARRVKREASAAVRLDELEAHGMEGLMQATRRYDRRRGASFSTFAGYRIRGAMLDALRARRRGPATEPLDEETVPCAGRCPEATVLDAEVMAQLRGALDGLPDHERLLIERVYWGGSQLVDAGAELGKSKSWASRLHARTLAKLRRELLRR